MLTELNFVYSRVDDQGIEPTMSNRLIQFSLTRPLVVYGLLVFLTAITGLMILNIQVDTDPENMLAQDEPDRVYHNQVKNEFLLNDLIVVGAVVESGDSIFNRQSLTDLKQLSDAIVQIDGVKQADVNSLATIDNIEQAAQGAIRFEWMMPQAPTTEVEAARIGEKSARLPFVVNSLVSGDNKAATIYVPILDKDESYRIAGEIKSVIATLSKANQYYITGLPVAEDTFGFEMFVQMGISAPAAALVIYLLMLYFFRSATLVIAPMVVAMATVIMIMGAMIGAGFTVHIMSSMIPIFLMPIAVVDSVHLMSEFADCYKSGENANKVISKVTGELFRPMLFTSVTSAAGFFSLALTPIPPVQIFGLFVGVGILLAFILTIIFVPAYISRMNPLQLKKMQDRLFSGQQSTSLLAEILPSWGRFSLSKSKLMVLAATALVAISVVGIYKIEINDNPVRWFKPSHEIRVADRVLNEHFAGTYDAHLVFEFGDKNALIENWAKQADELAVNNDLSESSQQQISRFFIDKLSAAPASDIFQEFTLLLDELAFDETDAGAARLEQLIQLTDEVSAKTRFFTQPQQLAYIEALQAHLLKSGNVGKSNSVVDLIKTVNRELRGGQAEDFRIPETQNGVSQTLLQYQSSHRPQDLWHFVTPDYSTTLVWLQLTSGDNQDMAAVVEEVNDYIRTHPVDASVKVDWAGKAYLNLVWQNKMVAGMFDSLTSAFVIVFIMMVLLFRSLLFGFLAMLPLSITIIVMYGIIGWIGKYYDMPIAVLSALTLGLSVDFAIHFIERTRAIYARKGDFKSTIDEMFMEPARAISRNALVIALGFTPLLLAPLVPYITVGAFLASIMAVSALVTLLLLPAAMQLLARWLFVKN